MQGFKGFSVLGLSILGLLLASCHDEIKTELKHIQNRDTIFFNMYTKVYSEDTSPQAVKIGPCVAGACKGDDLILEIPRVYFHSTLRARDDRSYFDIHFKKVPRKQWPAISTLENLSFLLACEGDSCVSYPSVCQEDKLKCAKRLRERQINVPRGLAKIEFEFYSQHKEYGNLLHNFVWTAGELIETLPGGYKRYTARSMSKLSKRDGGFYYPASDNDIFYRIQCRFITSDCEYLFYMDIDEAFANSLYGDKNKQLLVKASFENFKWLKFDFAEVNKRLDKIREGVCHIVPCKSDSEKAISQKGFQQPRSS